jgi:hypothetical protein
MGRSRRKNKKEMKRMKEEKKMNVGVVLTTTLDKWRLIEAFLSKNAEIVFVKKVPPAIKLRVRQEFEREEGEEENVRSERS